MSSRRNASIYILVGLLLIVGILIFAFKDRLLSYVSVRVFGEAPTGVEAPLKASAASVINLQILENNRFRQLENKVLYFDFNTVGKPVVNPDYSGKIPAPSWQPVYLGNANPFLVPVKAAPDSEEVK